MGVEKQHTYTAEVVWSGNIGSGTSAYASYSRDHEMTFVGAKRLAGSADPAFRGDPDRHNPEELLVAALSACHMLWYLHLCADAGVVVTGYRDRASARMVEGGSGGGHFVEAVLAPEVRIDPGSDSRTAAELHQRAHERCFIANSVNFPVVCRPMVTIEPVTLPPAAGATTDSQTPVPRTREET